MPASFAPRGWDGSLLHACLRRGRHRRTLLVVEPDPTGGHRSRIVDLDAPPEASVAHGKQS